MKTHTIAALCAIMFIGSQAGLRAEEEVPPAIRLLQVMEFEKSAIDIAAGMFEPMMEQFADAGLPAEAMADIRVATQKFMNKIFASPELIKGIAKIYEDHFSQAEIEELIRLYESPIGKKLMAVQAPISQATMELTIKASAENQAEFQLELMKIMEKYQEPGGQD